MLKIFNKYKTREFTYTPRYSVSKEEITNNRNVIFKKSQLANLWRGKYKKSASKILSVRLLLIIFFLILCSYLILKY